MNKLISIEELRTRVGNDQRLDPTTMQTFYVYAMPSDVASALRPHLDHIEALWARVAKMEALEAQVEELKAEVAWLKARA